MYRLEDARYYRPEEVARAGIATTGTLAQWRIRNRGPAFHRQGNKIHYLGVDINAWLDSLRIEPNGKPPRPRTK